MSTSDLKKELESVLLITKWDPSEAELNAIAAKIKLLGENASKASIEAAVLSVVGTYEAISLEGVDNSDLKALLLLATKGSGEK